MKRIKDVFSQPFRVGETRTGRERREERQRLYGSNGNDVDADDTESAAAVQSSQKVSRGRFIRDEEDQQVLLEQEAQRASHSKKAQTAAADSDPAAYVKPKNIENVVGDNPIDVDDDEDVQDAGESYGVNRDGSVTGHLIYCAISPTDDWDIMDGMTEEEKLQLALEMSISADPDEE